MPQTILSKQEIQDAKKALIESKGLASVLQAADMRNPDLKKPDQLSYLIERENNIDHIVKLMHAFGLRFEDWSNIRHILIHISQYVHSTHIYSSAYGLLILRALERQGPNHAVVADLKTRLLDQYEKNHPDLMAGINADNFFEKTKDQTYEEKLLIWFYVLKDHEKLIKSLKTGEQFSNLSQLLQYEGRPKPNSPNDFEDFRQKAFDLGVVQQVIHTMDDYLAIMHSDILLGTDGQPYQDILFPALQDKFSSLLKAVADSTELPGRMNTLPADLTLVLLKKMPLDLLSKELSRLLSWPVFNLSQPETKAQRDELFKFLQTFELSEEDRLRVAIYNHWEKLQRKDSPNNYFEGQTDAAIELLVSTLPAGLPKQQLTPLMKALVETPKILKKMFNDPPYRLSEFAPMEYKADFRAMEEALINKVTNKDAFIQALEQKFGDYAQRIVFFNRLMQKDNNPSLVEKRDLYQQLQGIIQTHRSDYALTDKTQPDKVQCLARIKADAEQIKVTLKVQEGRSLLAKFFRMLKSIAVFFGLAAAENTQVPIIVANYRDLFFKKAKTKTVKDLQEMMESGLKIV